VFLAICLDAAVDQERWNVELSNMSEGKQFVHSPLSRILTKSLPVRFINATIHAVTMWSTCGFWLHSRITPMEWPWLSWFYQRNGLNIGHFLLTRYGSKTDCMSISSRNSLKLMIGDSSGASSSSGSTPAFTKRVGILKTSISNPED